MSSISLAQGLEMQQRCQDARRRTTHSIPAPMQGHARESIVRQQIMDWCASQWPVWVVLTARTDVPSTLPIGAHDLTIFGPNPICMLVETKARGRKPRPEQLAWAARLAHLGWEVHYVWGWKGFYEVVIKKSNRTL